MSIKEWISINENGASLYQEFLYDHNTYSINPNPAVLEIDNPKNFSITREQLDDEKAYFELKVEIDAKQFDCISLDWCEARKLIKNKPGFKWPISEEQLTQCLEKIEDAELAELLKTRLNQKEIGGDFIFGDDATDDDEVMQSSENKDEIVKHREASELRGFFAGSEFNAAITATASVILSYIKQEQDIDNEERTIKAIERACEEILISNMFTINLEE